MHSEWSRTIAGMEMPTKGQAQTPEEEGHNNNNSDLPYILGGCVLSITQRTMIMFVAVKSLSSYAPFVVDDEKFPNRKHFFQLFTFVWSAHRPVPVIAKILQVCNGKL